MARTWTYIGTAWNLGTNERLNQNGLCCTSGDSGLYFYTEISGGGTRIYNWGGNEAAAPVDISGSLWTDTKYLGRGICLFDGGLYALIEDSSVPRTYIYKYDGSGTSWTLKHTVENAGANLSQEDGIMACDATRIVVATDRQPFSTDYHAFVASLDGNTWTLQTIDGGYSGEPEVVALMGVNHLSGYGEVVGMELRNGRIIAHDTGNDWAFLGAASYVNHFYLGHDGSYSFWVNNGSPYAVHRSTDWGVTLTDASAVFLNPQITYPTPNQHVRLVGGLVLMGCRGFNTDHNIYTYDGTAFVADGSIPDASYDVVGFFSLGSVLYAVAVDAYSDTRVYNGGFLVEVPFDLDRADTTYGLTHSGDGIPGAVLE